MPKNRKVARMRCVWTMAAIAAGLGVAQNSVLHIKVVAGDGASHAPGAHAKPLTVEVTDATGRPVAGARVSFQIPEDGPGGVFANGLRTDIAITDSNGRAAGHGLQLNRVAGSFGIRITAAKDQARAGTIARQSIGDGGAQIESADRKAPPPAPAVKEPEPAAAPQRPAPPPPTIAVPGTTATGPVKVAAQHAAPVAPTVRPAAEPSHGVPTIIVTEKKSRSIAEVGADSGHKSHKKWVWIGLLAAGGAGAAFATTSMGAGAAHGGGGAAAAGGLSSAAVSIGAPTITIGKP